jgi:O-antigen/teichoic acid export membrane protein
MIKLTWSLLERLLPRLASALLLLILAALTNPSVVGVYSWALLGYTAYQALTDAAIRQVMVRAVHSYNGLAFLVTYRAWASIGGFLGVGSVVVLLFMHTNDAATLILLPIAFAPACTAAGMLSVARLQVAGKWAVLARGQLVAATISLSVSLPCLLVTQNLLAGGLQVLLTEGIFAIWCVRNASNLDRVPALAGGASPKSEFFGMSAYSGLAWTQGQGDRFLLGVFAGTTQLGNYAFATAIARSLGDAMASATANVLRAETSTIDVLQPDRFRAVASRVLVRGLVIVTVVIIATDIATEFVLRPILGDEWAVPLGIVPILAIATLPSVLAWSSSVFHVSAGRTRRALWTPLVGIMFALPIAFVASNNLEHAAWIVVVRDVTVVTVSFLSAGRRAPWTVYLLCMALVVILSTIVAIVLSAN